MTAHTCATYDAMCWRCDLARDELDDQPVMTALSTDVTVGSRGEAGRRVPPRVIGADLSLTATGMSDGRSTWTVRSTGKEGASLYERDGRLRQIRAEVLSHCENATLVVIEG